MSQSSVYKKWHKPNMSESAKTHQGYFQLTLNPEKYVSSDPNEPIIYRSEWERKFCEYCCKSPSILQWSAEPISIPYYNRVANLEECKKYGLDPNNPANWKIANYHVDFWVKIKLPSGNTEKWLIEIKPKKECQPPKPCKSVKLKDQKRYNQEAKTWLINQAKWAAAKAFCEKQGWKFYVFHEDILSKLGVLQTY